MALSLELILFVGALLLILWYLTSKPKDYPPGPVKWPIVGNIRMLKYGGQIHKIMANIQKQYGDIAGVFDFHRPIVVISGLAAIREASFRDDLSGRPPNTLHKIMFNGKIHGIASTSGETWKVQRRFTLQHLRDLGFGKRTLESIAHEEIQAVFEDIEDISGGHKKGFPIPVNFHDVLGGTSINVLWHIIAGKRYEHRDPNFKNLIMAVQQLLQLGNPAGTLISLFPHLSKLFPKVTGLFDMVSSRAPIHKFLKEEVEAHKKTIDHDHPRDFIDIYLTEIERQKHDPDTTFTEQQLRQVCAEMFVAGTDTTLNTLSFGMLYMVLHQDVQKKVQQELDEVVGKDRLPTLDDRQRLLYIDATINEIMRCSTIAPTAVAHAPLTTEDGVNFRGHRIPKIELWFGSVGRLKREKMSLLQPGTIIFHAANYWVSREKLEVRILSQLTQNPVHIHDVIKIQNATNARILLNLYGLHHDPKLWKSPEEFNPERFLQKNGEHNPRDALLPFGAGKRVCLGESLARNNVFLFFTAILQRYTLRVPDGHPTPTMKPEGKTVLFPKPFTVKVNLRT